MVSFWDVVNKVIIEADVILEVLDARNIFETRNSEVEDKVKKAGKPLIYVINKCDLVDKVKLEKEKKKLRHSVFISSVHHLGTGMLREKIMSISKGEQVKVGVLGYPNTGKSSLINALKGSGAAKTSSESGYTKGLQRVRASGKIVFLDTPGVIPYKEDTDRKHVKISAIDYSKIKEPDLAAMQLIDETEGLIQKFYGVLGKDSEEILENIAIKYKKLKKGGTPNMEVTGRMILRDWQIGKIKHI
ncbi:GTPase [Candidatus Woesearchaeota archaeon]|jgi:ribosome biogenesis GTPase A|nr:GTPase [Candidatus Woesearchaeota archaeon]